MIGALIAITLCVHDPDAANWNGRVAAGGGAVQVDVVRAQAKYNIAGKGADFWFAENRGSHHAGLNLAAALVPYKIGSGAALDTNQGFVAADYTPQTGFTANGSTKYLKTGLIPSTALTANSTHIGQYIRDSRHGTFENSLGAMNTADTSAFNSYVPSSDGNIYDDQYNGTTSEIFITPPAGIYGNVVLSVLASNLRAIYQNGVSQGGPFTTVAGSLPAFECYVFAANQNGTAADFSDHTGVGYRFGSRMTAAMAAAQDAAEQQFQQAHYGRRV